MNFNAALPPGFSDLLTALNGGLAGWLLVLLATTTATIPPCSRAAMLQQPRQTKALFHSLWLLRWLPPTLVTEHRVPTLAWFWIQFTFTFVAVTNQKLPNKMIKIIFILFLVTMTVSQIDNFFCRSKENSWTFCRTCPTIDKKCPQDPEGCHCENIQISDPEQDGKMIGGSDCNEGFCYVSKYNMQKT